VSTTDSLGERIQRAFPAARVVKALNTMNAVLMVNPRQLADGGHTVFVCGDNPEAKALVTGLLTDGFGWRDVIDLGDLTAARATEMVLPIWLRLGVRCRCRCSTSRWSGDPERPGDGGQDLHGHRRHLRDR
jgi:8-hydroxy-5-deazaflavin:NADPH oxidoreductase